MAVGGLLALLDDLAVLMDDVAVMSKVAAGKTAGITGDDLAVNAEALTGLDPKRELPIVWAVAKGSLANKALLIPGALLLSAIAPWSIVPLLMIGGLFLCFEGVEKVVHALATRKSGDHAALVTAALKSEADLMAFEQDKIKQAIRTDLILSAEIVAIVLGTVADKPFATQVMVLCLIGIGMTVVVYGLVGLLIKLDDIALYLSRRASRAAQATGRSLLATLPWMMKSISVLGTAAMFTVGGGILVHGLPWIEAEGRALAAALTGDAQATLVKILFDAVIGIVAGAGLVAAHHQLMPVIKAALKKSA